MSFHQNCDLELFKIHILMLASLSKIFFAEAIIIFDKIGRYLFQFQVLKRYFLSKVTITEIKLAQLFSKS